MVEKIINAINRDLNGIEYYNLLVVKNELGKNLDEKRNELEIQLNKQKEFPKKFPLFYSRIEKEQQKEIENKINELNKDIKRIETDISNINLTDENLKQAESISTIKEIVDLYNSKNYKECCDKLIEYFDYDFKKIISFCNENNIDLDFSSDLLINKIDNLNYLLNCMRQYIESPASFQQDEFRKDALNSLKIFEENLNNSDLNKNNEELINLFKGIGLMDIHSLKTFFKENNIKVNWSTEDYFLDSMHLIVEKNLENNKAIDKIDSLSQMCMVRKTDQIPINDKLIPINKLYLQKIGTEVVVNGETKQIEVEIPKGHSTIHWCINQEVLPHSGNLVGWAEKNVTLLQPLNDDIYSQFTGLKPIDSYVFGEMNLDNYYALCSNSNVFSEIKSKNEKSIPIVFPIERINGGGNFLLALLGNYPNRFHIFDGGLMDGKYPLSSYYTPELIEKYPNLCSSKSIETPVYSLEHAMRDRAINFLISCQKVDYIIENTLSETSIDELIDSITEEAKWSGINYFRKLNVKISDILPYKYASEYSIMDTIVANSSEISAQFLFEQIISGVEISKENYSQIQRIKEYVIKEFEDYNINKNDETLDILLSKCYILRKIATSNALNRKIDETKEIPVPLQYYDFSDLEKSIIEITNNGDLNDFQNILTFIIEKIYENQSSISLQLTSPQNSGELQLFLKKINDLKSNIVDEEYFRILYSELSEEEKQVLEYYIQEYTNSPNNTPEEINRLLATFLVSKSLNNNRSLG